MAEVIDADYVIQRLVATAPDHCIRRGDDIVPWLPAATSSADGKMTAAQAAAVATMRGSGTTAQRNAISSPQGGWTWINTDWQSRLEVYDANTGLWLPSTHIALINKTGADSIEGYSVLIDTGTDFGFVYPAADLERRIIGVVAEGGIANNNWCPIAVSGICNIYIDGSDSVTRGDYIYSQAGGKNKTDTSNYHDKFAFGLESHASGSDYLVKGKMVVPTELY